MKTSTLLCFAVVFLFAAFASADSTAHTPATSYSEQDVNEFVRGLWEAISLGHGYEELETCLTGQTAAGAQLIAAFALLNSTTDTVITTGLNQLASPLSIITAALSATACSANNRYTNTYKEMVGNFTAPYRFTYTPGSSLSIDGVEVYAEVKKTLKTCARLQMAACGDALGNAIGKVYYGQQDVTSSATVARLNQISHKLWTAGVNPEFDRLNLWEFKKKRVSLQHNHSQTTTTASTTTSTTTATTTEASNDTSAADSGSRRRLVTMPTAFDSRTRWPSCIHPIRDQGQCSSCWAVAASEVLSDRFCIASNVGTNVILGPQYMVSCDTSNKGCSGGTLGNVWKFLETNGEVSEACFPYASMNNVAPACSTFTKCADNSWMRKYYVKQGSSKSFTTTSAIQNEIYTNGPIESGMMVYSDFMSYSSGIYHYVSGSFLGGHAIKIVGWGTQSGVNYWIVANSWGTSWGEQGFFRIQMGQCSIETMGYAGIPDFSRV